MKTPLDNLLSRYQLVTVDDSWAALREIIQEIVLLGLWRGKFFEHAAFYGGTAIRIVHGMQRYSEDMDFSLLAPDAGWKLGAYFPFVEQELRAFGFEVTIEQKTRYTTTAIESAFVKTNTRTGFLRLGMPQSIVNRLSREQLLKVKFEIDIDPPGGFKTETRFLYTPQVFSVKLFDLPSMFAGKLHAAIARSWKTRVKGRDWYDLVWFVGKNVSASLVHLKSRLVQTGHLNQSEEFTKKEARELLKKRIEKLDINTAKKDVSPFLAKNDALQLTVWSKEFFLDCANRITFI